MSRFFFKKATVKKVESILILITILPLSLLFMMPQHNAYSSFVFNPKVNVSMINNGVTDPQIVVIGNNSSIIWSNRTSSFGEIALARSTDNGTSYSTAIDISHTANDSSKAKIAASGNNVYVVWQEKNMNNQIYFSRSTNYGISFSPSQNITNPSVDSTLPQIATSGNNVYIVWQEINTTQQVFLTKSNDNGTSFGPKQNLSNSVNNPSSPIIAASGSNVYLAWQENIPNLQVFFSSSTNNGSNFNSPQNLSHDSGDSLTPQLKASGSNVYVVWEDLTSGIGQIYIATSSNAGTSFGTTQQTSNTPNESQAPQLAVCGSNVYVTWYSDPGSGLPEVYFRGSNNNGIAYNSLINLSSNSGDSFSPVVTCSGSNVYVAWIDDTTGNLDIFFKSSSDSGSHFGSFKNFINTPGLDLPIPQIAANSDVYVTWNQVIGGIGDIFVISGSGSASSNDITLDNSEYKIGQTATIRIISPSSNATGATIDANVTSTTDQHGIIVTLPETDTVTANFTGPLHFHSGSSNQGNSTLQVSPGDVVTASFAGESGTAFIFSRTISFDFTAYTLDKSPIITVNDQNSDLNTLLAESIPVNVNSTSFPTGITFLLNESGSDTGIFVGKMNFSETVSSSTTHTIKVKVRDNVTASFGGKSARATILPPIAPGGGGGGPIVSPGLVLDAALVGGYLPGYLLDLIKSHDPNQPIAPGADKSLDYPFSINGNGYALSSYSNKVVTNVLSTGESIPIGFIYYNPSPVIHISIYFNIRGQSSSIANSDTYILYDIGQSPKIVDPHGFFTTADFSESKNGLENKFTGHITFAKPMGQSDIIVRAWTDTYLSGDTLIEDAINIVQSNQNVQPAQSNQTVQTTSNAQNPAAQSQSSEPDLMSEIKEWGGYSSQSISDDDLLKAIKIEGKHIPSWVMKTTKYLVDGQIQVQDFVNLISYMSKTGLIK